MRLRFTFDPFHVLFAFFFTPSIENSFFNRAIFLVNTNLEKTGDLELY